MSGRTSILLYLTCVAVPVLVGSLLALRLLGREEARLRSESRSALEERAQLAAENLSAAVRDTQDTLLGALRAIPPSDRDPALRGLRTSNPLVRNVFILGSGPRLRLPDPARLLSDEERAFVARYAPYWDGRQRFTPAAATEQVASSGRQSLYETAAKAASQIASRRSADAAAIDHIASGWVNWFHEGQLFLLAWVRGADDAVYGLELERAALESRLQSALPAPADGETGLALIDGSGRVVAQRGPVDALRPDRPALRIPVGPVLPHWEIALYGGDRAAGAPSSRFRGVAVVIVLGLGVAVLTGGLLLYREARRQALDAQRKTSFVANVSHELRTPLTTIRMYAEMLAEGRVVDTVKRQGYLDTLVSESQRLTRLIDNVLDFSRLETDRKRYRPTVFDAAAWLEAWAETHRARAAHAGVSLVTEKPAGEARVQTDRDAAEQILLNLLDNALKYAASGGEVRIEWRRGETGWICAVQDRGPGVPARLAARIFEKFFRIDDRLTAQVPGSGLGLSIARRLARDLGGDLVYRPRAGGGSSFEWSIPDSGGSHAAG